MESWISKIAPMIGTALGGPLGGIAAEMLASKIGIPEKTVEAVKEAVSGQKLTGDQLAGIKAAEIEFQKFLETNKIDLAKLDVQNTQGARDMFSATRSNTPSILSFVVTFGFFAILLTMILQPEQKASEPLLILLGALGAAFGAVVNFWLGSSHGSNQKSALLATK